MGRGRKQWHKKSEAINLEPAWLTRECEYRAGVSSMWVKGCEVDRRYLHLEGMGKVQVPHIMF